MSVEQTLIARARPHMLRAMAEALFRGEVSKGCLPDIALTPVSLEPTFRPISQAAELVTGETHKNFSLEPKPSPAELARLQVWLSPEEKFSWLNSELFLKQLSTISHRVGFETLGNRKRIQIQFLAHRIDLPIIETAFRGQFQHCRLSDASFHFFGNSKPDSRADIAFLDCFPPPPYSHLLTRPDELKVTTYRSLVAALTEIDPPAIGFYQALLQPVKPEHNWKRNVEVLLDLEYSIKLNSGLQSPQRYLQQSPSGDLRGMAIEVETKSHNDKPFYCVGIRLGVAFCGADGPAHLKALSTFLNLFQSGGRPLNYVTEKQYLNVLSPEQIREMFLMGLTYRPGFLLNSYELSSLVHIPPLSICEPHQIPLEKLETLPVRNPELLKGTRIGTCSYAGSTQQVCLPENLRELHTHLIGGSGVGKSSTQEYMIMHDIEGGHGVGVIDPHGDLIERLLCLIPEQHVERTIYINPGDPDWVPLWNPLKKIVGQDAGRSANSIVRAIKSFVASGGWGDRMENILRNTVFALLHLPQGNFLDISNVLHKSKESEIMRKEILSVIDNETARQFWLHDYENYGKNEFAPPINKLGKLLLSDTVSLMLSQPESRLNFRKIMDEGMILLIDLSDMDINVKQVLGCFILSILHLNALSRSKLRIKDRKQFHIHCDEAHQFASETFENIIAETRKYKVSLSLSHQYLSQFGKKKMDALSTVGSSIIFNVDSSDAHYLTKDLQEKVKMEELVSLKRWEAIARIGTDIVRMKTLLPPQSPATNFKDRIIQESRRKYYKPVHEVKQWIRHRGDRWRKPFSPLTFSNAETGVGDCEEFVYDEF